MEDAWKIIVEDNFWKDYKRLGRPKQVVKKLKELSLLLKRDPERLLETLGREPIIYEVEREGVIKKVRRMHVGKYRIFFVIDYERKPLSFMESKNVRKRISLNP